MTELLPHAGLPPSYQRENVTGDMSSRVTVKCTPEVISGCLAGSDLLQGKSCILKRPGLDCKTLSESFHPYLWQGDIMVYQDDRLLDIWLPWNDR